MIVKNYEGGRAGALEEDERLAKGRRQEEMVVGETKVVMRRSYREERKAGGAKRGPRPLTGLRPTVESKD